MMDEEEDVVFDRTNLLTNRLKAVAEIHDKAQTRYKAVKTFFLCAAFFGLGLCIAIPGPTLLDLRAQTNTSTEQITQIFIGRSIGTLVGSFAGGFLYDRMNEACLLSFSLFLMSVGTAVAPWSRHFMLLFSVVTFQGLSMGLLDTGCNYVCLNIWGRKSGPYMQAMHFSLGLGSFVAPLIAEPFLGKTPEINVISSAPVMTIQGSRMTNQNENSNGTKTVSPTVAEPKIKRRDVTPSITPSNVPSTTTKKIPKKPDYSSAKTRKDKNIKKELSNNLKTQKTDTDNPQPSKSNISSITTSTSTTTTTTTATTTTTTTTTTISPSVSSKSVSGSVSLSTTSQRQNGSHSNTSESDSGNKSDQLLNKVKELANSAVNALYQLTRVQFAYLAISLYSLLLSWIFAFLCCKDGRKSGSVRNDAMEEQFIIKRENKGFRVQILILLFFFYFLYMGMEQTYGALIMTFAVKSQKWTKEKGVMLTATYWGSFAAMRALSIFLAKGLTPAIMLIADLIITCVSLIGLVLSQELNDLVLWIFTATLGIGMASIFPTGITWAERYMHITGKATSVILIGSSLGSMCIPAATGFMFDMKGPNWLLYILLGSGILSGFLYVIMQNLASNKGERYEKLVGGMEPTSLLDNDELEMAAVENHANSNTANGKKKVTFKLPSEVPFKARKTGKTD